MLQDKTGHLQAEQALDYFADIPADEFSTEKENTTFRWPTLFSWHFQKTMFPINWSEIKIYLQIILYKGNWRALNEDKLFPFKEPNLSP